MMDRRWLTGLVPRARRLRAGGSTERAMLEACALGYLVVDHKEWPRQDRREVLRSYWWDACLARGVPCVEAAIEWAFASTPMVSCMWRDDEITVSREAREAVLAMMRAAKGAFPDIFEWPACGDNRLDRVCMFVAEGVDPRGLAAAVYDRLLEGTEVKR